RTRRRRRSRSGPRGRGGRDRREGGGVGSRLRQPVERLAGRAEEGVLGVAGGAGGGRLALAVGRQERPVRLRRRRRLHGVEDGGVGALAREGAERLAGRAEQRVFYVAGIIGGGGLPFHLVV